MFDRKATADILRARDGSVCGICRLELHGPIAIDHIRPLNCGGHRTALANLQLAHRVCNIRKLDSWIPGEGVAADVDVALTAPRVQQKTDPHRKAINFLIDASIGDKLRAIAQSRGMLMNAYARQVIARHIQRVTADDTVAPV